MSDLATIPTASAPVQPQSEQKTVKTPRVPKKIVQLVDLLVSGECRTQTAGCQRLKLDRSYACKQLKLPHVLAYMEHRTRICLAQSQVPAAATMLRLLDEATSEHVQKDVAIHLLSIAGHKPAANTQVSVNVDIKAGYVIDLSGDDRKPMIDVSHAVLTDHGTERE